MARLIRCAAAALALALTVFVVILPVRAETPASVVVPVRTIPIGSVVRETDLRLVPVTELPAADVLRRLEDAAGLEAQRTLYSKRPVRARDIGPITLVRRNARIEVRFRRGPIELTTIGRALEAGGLGEMIRVMNLDSRRTVYGRIVGPEVVDVGS